MMKKITVQMKILKDKTAIDSPASTVSTPIIIVFLTYPYIPLIINFLVGLQGANVPFPILIKVDTVINMTNNPMNMRISPINKAHKCFIERSCSMVKGIRIKTVMGSIKEMICLITFRMIWLLLPIKPI